MSLFPGAAARSPYLLEFKAGRMKREGKMVTADTRKGIVAIHQADDSLMHFVWKDRKNNRSDEDSDLIVFPEEAEFRKVKQTDQRVYMLIFKGSNKKFFFWMQEPKSEKDVEYVRKVNWLLNNPPVPGETGDVFAGMDMDFSNGAMEEDKDASTASTDTAAAPSETASSAPGSQPTAADLAMLQTLLRGIKMPDNVDLHQVLSPEVLAPLLDNPDALDRLKPFLPPPHTSEALSALIKSPQFYQAVQAFNAALKSGDVNPQALGVESEQTGAVAGVEAFLKVLQSEADRKQAGEGEEGKEEEKKADDTDKMDDS